MLLLLLFCLFDVVVVVLDEDNIMKTYSFYPMLDLLFNVQGDCHKDIFFLLCTRAQKLSRFLQQCTEVETSVNHGHRNSIGGRLRRWSTSIQHVFRYTPVYLYSAWSDTQRSSSIQHAVRYTLIYLHSASN